MSPDLSDNARELLLNGILSAKNGDVNRAHFYLEWVLRECCTHDQRLKALYYLGKIAPTRPEKLKWLEELLLEDPGNPEARRDLGILRGQISAAGVPDPNVPPTPAATAPLANRKTNCDQCGGKLVFSPDGKGLDCERCGIRYPLTSLSSEPTSVAARPALTPSRDDFIVQMAQAKGHAAPRPVRSFTCSTCGATFALPETSLSLNCPYCGTGFIPEAHPRDWIPPQTVMPFAVERDLALAIFHRWEGTDDSLGADLVRDVYLPIWDFDFSGTMEITRKDGSGATLTEWPVNYGHILVPGTRSIPAHALPLLQKIDFAKALPFQPELLTNRVTEMYTIAPADASLAARESIFQRESASHKIPPAGFLNPARLCANTCGLLLVPFWIAQLHSSRAFIFGQTGDIAGKH